MPKSKDNEVFLIVHNVRSILNIGSLFRTADAAGVKKIFLCGYTPTPLNHSEKMKKTSLGAEQWMPWEYYAHAWRLFKYLRLQGVRIAALEQSRRSKNIFRYRMHGPIALVVGNEVRGLSNTLLQKCDDIVEIPMHGKKESLNVAVAVGIAVYQLLR